MITNMRINIFTLDVYGVSSFLIRPVDNYNQLIIRKYSQLLAES